MQVPDIVGFTLMEAKPIIERNGLFISRILITSPPRQKYEEAEDSFRVIRINSIDKNKVELLVCKPL